MNKIYMYLTALPFGKPACSEKCNKHKTTKVSTESNTELGKNLSAKGHWINVLVRYQLIC